MRVSKELDYDPPLDPIAMKRALRNLPDDDVIDILKGMETAWPDKPMKFLSKLARDRRSKNEINNIAKAAKAKESLRAKHSMPETIQRKIAWLNKKGNLFAPLQLDKIALYMGRATEAQQIEVLSLLRHRAEEEKEPNKFVVMECRKRAAENADETERMQAGELIGEAAVKRIHSLNKFWGLKEHLDLTRLIPVLSEVPEPKRLEVLALLKKTCRLVEDPHAFVISYCEQAKKSAQNDAAKSLRGKSEALAQKAAEKGEEWDNLEDPEFDNDEFEELA